MKKQVKDRVYTYFSRHPSSALSRFGVKLANFILSAHYNSSNHIISSNGEARLIMLCFEAHTRTRSDEPIVLFDVGANVGEWTEVAHKICGGHCKIHAFEIVPSTRQKLIENVRSKNNISIASAGLSNHDGITRVKHYHSQPTGSSEYDLPWGELEHEFIDVECMTGDKYSSNFGCPRINFLKIDVEGADFKVLEGFNNMLQSRQIDCIQFEYNKAAALSKYMLGDYFELLTSYGYKVGRIYPNRVDFREYDLFRDENLMQSNFFAVKHENVADYC